MAGGVASNRGRLAWRPQAITGCSRLDRRIERILADGQPRTASLSPASWAVIVVCAIPLLCATAAVRLERSQAGSNGQSLNEMELLVNGWNLKPADVQRLEDQVKRNPEDLNARTLLLSYYFQNAVRHPRVEHIFWLIEHHPDSTVLETRGAALLRVKDNPLNTDADYELAKMLWLSQVERYPSNERVLHHAVNFLTAWDLPLA